MIENAALEIFSGAVFLPGNGAVTNYGYDPVSRLSSLRIEDYGDSLLNEDYGDGITVTVY